MKSQGFNQTEGRTGNRLQPEPTYTAPIGSGEEKEHKGLQYKRVDTQKDGGDKPSIEASALPRNRTSTHPDGIDIHRHNAISA